MKREPNILLILGTDNELLRMCLLELNETRSAESVATGGDQTRNAIIRIEVDLTKRTAELRISHFEFKLLYRSML